MKFRNRIALRHKLHNDFSEVIFNTRLVWIQNEISFLLQMTFHSTDFDRIHMFSSCYRNSSNSLKISYLSFQLTFLIIFIMWRTCTTCYIIQCDSTCQNFSRYIGNMFHVFVFTVGYVPSAVSFDVTLDATDGASHTLTLPFKYYNWTVYKFYVHFLVQLFKNNVCFVIVTTMASDVTVLLAFKSL